MIHNIQPVDFEGAERIEVTVDDLKGRTITKVVVWRPTEFVIFEPGERPGSLVRRVLLRNVERSKFVRQATLFERWSWWKRQ